MQCSVPKACIRGERRQHHHQRRDGSAAFQQRRRGIDQPAGSPASLPPLAPATQQQIVSLLRTWV